MTVMIQVATSAFVDQRLESIMSLVKLSQMEQWREKYYGDLRKCKKVGPFTRQNLITKSSFVSTRAR